MVVFLAESPIDLISLTSYLNTQRIKSLIILQRRFLESILRGSGDHSIDMGVHRVEDVRNNVFEGDGKRASHGSMVQVLYCDEEELESLYPGSTRHDGDVGVTLWFKSVKTWAGALHAEEGSQTQMKSLTLQKTKGTTSKMGLMDIIVLLAKAVKSEGSNTVCVGVVMKPSRWQALARRGMFPLLPTKNNVFFIPLDCDALECSGRIEECIHVVDVLLHKPTDFMTLVKGNGEVSFATKFLEFLDAFSKASSIPIVEPIYKFKPVVNRVCMMEGLERACGVAQRKGLDVRVPACVTINDSRHVPVSSLLRAPCIVKPVAACGVPESHRMAIVYPDSTFDWKAIKVPMPAIIQEYINHNATVFKVYVAGEKVFVEQRESLPNVSNSPPPKTHDDLIFYFDSLQRTKSEHQSCTATFNDSLSLEVDNVKADQKNWTVDKEYKELASILKNEFQLELFGFDVIFDCQHGKAAIIDLNYFPSYSSVEGAVRAVQLALKAKVWSKLGNAPNMTE